MPNESGPNKRLNGPDGRVRNTSTSNESRSRPTVPNLGESYGSAAGLTTGLANAWAELQNMRGAMKSQRVSAGAAFKTARADARSKAVGAMSEAINAGIEGGMTGSSAVGQERIGVLGQRRQDIEAAAAVRTETVLNSRIQESQAVQSFDIAQSNAEMQAKAMQQQQAIADAALAAQKQGTADMLAYLESQGRTVPGTIRGREIQTLPNGDMRVAGMTFDAGTSVSVVEAAIRHQRQDRLQTAQTESYLSARLAAGRM